MQRKDKTMDDYLTMRDLTEVIEAADRDGHDLPLQEKALLLDRGTYLEMALLHKDQML